MDLFNRKKVKALQEENNKLKKELEKLKLSKDELRCKDLKNEIKNLNNIIEEKKEIIKNYNFDLESFENISSLKEAITHYNLKIEESKSTLKDIKEKIDIAEEKFNKTNKEIYKASLKLSKIKPLYLSVKNILYTYPSLDIFNENISKLSLNKDEEDLLNQLAPTVTLHLHSMDVKSLRKEMTINNKAIDTVLSKYENRYTTKSNLSIYRLMVIALRAELQNILHNLKYDKISKSIDDVKTITKKYLSIADNGNQQILGTITKFISEIEYLFIQAVKIEYEYYLKKQREKEEQAALREQMKQEAEERKLLQQQKKQVEKEEEKYKNEILKIQEQINASNESNKISELQARIEELNKQLEKVEEKKEEIISRQNGKAGYVYIISNLGSFGDNIFKIGMTRRLNPMDRISELSSASVPFSFDVHSFIFSEDAVSLEQKIHNILNNQRVNKVNLRKEFFKADIYSLKKLVENIDPSAEFNITMLAEQYRESLCTSSNSQ